jgi:hypothetical protein
VVLVHQWLPTVVTVVVIVFVAAMTVVFVLAMSPQRSQLQ